MGALRKMRTINRVLKQAMDHSDAVAESFHRYAKAIRYGCPQATYGCAGFNLKMAVPFSDSASDRNNRQGVGSMRIRVAHAGAIEQKRMVQERSTAVVYRAQLFEELCVHTDVINVDPRDFRNLFCIVLMKA